MKRSARILVIEDDPRWQEVLTETLRSGGFQVEVAASKADASKKLATLLFHLLVVDLRLEDQDPSNLEGMDLIQELTRYGLADSFLVIILTAFGTKGLIREAFKQHGVVDFLSKQDFDEDEGAFLAEVQRLFDQEGSINLDLVIHWQGGFDSHQAVVKLLVDGQRVKKATPEQELLAVELDDLLCRLFHDAESLLIDRLVRGKSGAGVVLVHQSVSPRSLDLLREHQEHFCLRHILSREVERAGFTRNLATFSEFIGDLGSTRYPFRPLLVAANTDGKIPAVDEEVQRLGDLITMDLLRIGLRCKPTLLAGDEATYARVKEELRHGRHHLFHYAGHGRYDDDHPQANGLVLSDGAGTRALTADDLRLVAGSDLQLVFLSCCLGAVNKSQCCSVNQAFALLARRVSLINP